LFKTIWGSQAKIAFQGPEDREKRPDGTASRFYRQRGAYSSFQKTPTRRRMWGQNVLKLGCRASNLAIIVKRPRTPGGYGKKEEREHGELPGRGVVN